MKDHRTRKPAAAVFALLAGLGCGGGQQTRNEANQRGNVEAGGAHEASVGDAGAEITDTGADVGMPPVSDGAVDARADGTSSDAGFVLSCESLPPEPSIPQACATLFATQAVMVGAVPDETNLDTTAIQAAINACTRGQAVRLAASGTNNAFVTGPLSLPFGVSLWVDAGATLFGSRNPSVYGATCGTPSGGSCSPLISVRNAGSGIVGKGVIDGQGGEPLIGQTQSWWELTGSTGGNSANPALIETLGATNFTMYEITLHNSPKFHVKLDANGFVIWGVTIKTPSAATNSQGTMLTPSGAHNTDGIDPGETVSDGYIVYNEISDGDDQIAIKGASTAHDIVIAHNHFLAGHGMSIGSETNGGVHGIRVCDLSIDGTMIAMAGSSNGIRIKSNPGVGGLVTDVTYSDVCVRGVISPIVLNPFYASATGSIPDFTGITISDFHSVGTSPAPKVTIEGYDMDHVTELTLDNVVFDAPPTVTAQFADVTIGPGGASFQPMGNAVTVTVDPADDAGVPNACTDKWVSF